MREVLPFGFQCALDLLKGGDKLGEVIRKHRDPPTGVFPAGHGFYLDGVAHFINQEIRPVGALLDREGIRAHGYQRTPGPGARRSAVPQSAG